MEINKKIAALGTLFLGLAVILGAFGAHKLKEMVSANMIEVFQKGVTYQFYHGFGLLILSLFSNHIDRIFQKWTQYLFVAGILIFSGFLYAYSLTNTSIFAIIVPIGGLCFIGGWVLFTIGLLRKK